MATVLLLVQFFIRFCNVVCVGKERKILKKDFDDFPQKNKLQCSLVHQGKVLDFQHVLFFLKYLTETGNRARKDSGNPGMSDMTKLYHSSRTNQKRLRQARHISINAYF